MILHTIMFGVVLAIVPAIGLLAIWYSGKQRRLESERANQSKHHRIAGC